MAPRSRTFSSWHRPGIHEGPFVSLPQLFFGLWPLCVSVSSTGKQKRKVLLAQRPALETQHDEAASTGWSPNVGALSYHFGLGSSPA